MKQIYETIFRRTFTDWGPWESLAPEHRAVFEEMAAQTSGAPEKLEPGIYRAKAQSWVEDVIDTKDGAANILRVRFAVPLASGRSGQVDWTCWLDNMLNEEGKASHNLKGLLNLGVTQEDVQGWLTGQTDLCGLDRAEVEIEVEKDAKGYLRVKWVNTGARELRAQRPLDRAGRAAVAAKMLAALASLGKGAAAPSVTRPASQEGKKCVEHGAVDCGVCPPF